jgi:glycine betaine/proline transport system substrate-binding protein
MFKNWKLFSSCAITALITMSLLGCGSQSTSTEKTNQSGESVAKSSTNKTVTIGYANWAEDEAITHLWKVILEKQGYTVKLVEGEEGTLFQGMSKGDIDLFLDVWLPSDNIYPNKYKDTVVPISNWFKGDALVGLAVPKYLTNVNTYEDLEKNGKVFNNQIVGNEPGAGNVVLMKDTVMPGYGLKDFRLLVSSESAMVSALEKAYESKKAIAVTAWAPHWIFAKYDLKFLPDPKNLNGGPSKLTSFANKEFPNKNKQVYDWFKNFEMDSKQMNTLELYIFHDNMKDDDAAAKWIKENESTVNNWIGKNSTN